MRRHFLQAWAMLLASGVLAAVSGCSQTSSTPLSQQAYVWQRVWSAPVSEAARNAPREVSAWRVLTAEAESTGAWREFRPDLDALHVRDRGLIAVIRIDGQRPIFDLERLESRILDRVRLEPDGTWSGLEIDYDCPSRALVAYGRLLRRLRATLPRQVALSITALPAWLSSDSLEEVLTPTDSSVLQVHSVMDPHRGLFDSQHASEWIEAFARRTSRPFYVALPNYGSRVTWDAQGRLIAVTSENTGFTPNQAGLELKSDPIAVAELCATLRRRHPAMLRGFVWFRLPVAGDQRIWSAQTWQRVMSGAPLEPHLTPRLSQDASGAAQLRLINDGSVDVRLPRVVSVPGPCPAADGEGLYSIEHYPTQTSWRLSAEHWLPAGRAARIGWLRCALNTEVIHLDN